MHTYIPLDDLLTAARRIRAKQDDEQRLARPWQIFKSGYLRYNERFSSYGMGRRYVNLSNFIENTFSPTSPITILELAGQGNLIEDLIKILPAYISGGVYTTLGENPDNPYDSPTNHQKIWSISRNKEHPNTTGNFLSHRFWARLNEMREDVAPEGFGLAVCLLEGGWGLIPENYGLYYVLLNNLFNIMKVGGFIFLDLPPTLTDEMIFLWVEEVNSSGIADIDIGLNNCMYITKLLDANLPKLLQVNSDILES